MLGGVTTRTIAWVMALGFVAMAVGALMFATAKPAAGGTIGSVATGSVCDAGEPGWANITDASSTSASNTGFLCNYKVDRSNVTLSDGTQKNLGQSGVAITIEYFCTPAQGRDRYKSVAGPRNEETYRDDNAGVLITEEGPQAKFAGNPQADGVFSTFFVDSQGNQILFGLQEKEWRLLNDQVFATIVVLTNERGKVAETERFGVDQAEVVARALAERSRSAAGCSIPPIGSSTTTTDSGGGLPVVVASGLMGGGAGIVVIGGITVWRRRPGMPPIQAPKVAGKVPPQCQGIAELYDDAVQTLTTLREAEVDLSQQFDRAERIHKNNLIKARMVVNLEIISALGNTATDLALALRPAVLRRVGPGAIGQKDTWRPPGSLASRWTDQIRAAEEAARTAWGASSNSASTPPSCLCRSRNGSESRRSSKAPSRPGSST